MPKQDVAVELFYDGGWHDLVPAGDVLISEPLKVMRGDSDESAAPRPATISGRLNNDHDMFRTSNPESPLYGKAGLNTPLRLSVGGVVRGYVEASEWAAEQTRDFRATPKRGSAWVDVEGGGLLQRINSWTEKLQSPLRKVNSDLTQLVGYWPMENEPNQATLLPTVAGSRTGTVRYVTAPSNDYPKGSEPLASIDSGGFVEGYFAQTGATVDGWQLSWLMRLPVQPDGSTAITPMEWELVDGSTGSMQWSGTDILLFTFGPTGLSQLNITVDGSGTDWTRWNMIRLKVSLSGGTVTGELSWLTEDTDGFVGVSDTYAASATSELSRWFLGIASGGENAGTSYGHLLGTSGVADDLESDARADSFVGYDGEAAAVRFGRLMDERVGSGHYYVSASYASSRRMGPQPVATLAEHIREIRATEDALVFDYISDARLYFLCRADRLNQTPALRLNAADIPTGLPNLPTEVTDDLGVHNLVTISQRNGIDYTIEDSTSTMGTAAPPDGRGEYEQKIDVNLADPDADQAQLANWWLRRGTVNRPRFPQVVVNLAALDAAKVAEVEQVDVGTVIEIVNYREYTIRLYVIGYTEVIGTHSRMISFTCAPDQQFQTGVYDGDSNYTPRYDLRTCTLSTAYGPTTTTLVFSFVHNEKWSQTQAFDLLVAGELIGVPAGGMGAQSGSGPYAQTLTGAVRSKNGIRKTLPSGSEVHINTQGRWA